MPFPNSFTIPPTSDGRYDAADQTTVVLIGLLCPLTMICVLLRFLARRRTKASLWWDDWLAILSLLFFYAFSAISLLGKLILFELPQILNIG